MNRLGVDVAKVESDYQKMISNKKKKSDDDDLIAAAAVEEAKE